MISKQYFEESFSLSTAQALQQWANNNLIIPDDGSYGMEVRSNTDTAIPVFAETALSGLTIGITYTTKMYVYKVVSNAFRVFVNALPSDNTSAVLEQGWWGTGWNTFTFEATAETMYLAVGDNVGHTDIYSITDNISVKDTLGTEFVTNGTFEAGNTTGWYDQGTNAVITAYEYAAAPPVGDNPYLEPVNIPEYDSGNSEHVIITTSNGNWSLINDASKKHFYVEAGDYGTTIHDITRSGTGADRRTISLYNYNDTHPGKLPSNELAHFKILLNGASYWTVDRIAYSIRSVSNIVEFKNGATDNIINRLYSDEVGRSVWFRRNCHRNTLQNSRLNSQTRASRLSDMVGVEFNDWSSTNDMYDNKVINNEIRNHNDAIQLVLATTDGTMTNDYQGTIIDSNDLYIDDTIYTDGSGNLDPNGLWSESEDGIDLKVGSRNASNPVIITNNHIWGFRRTDRTDHNSNSQGDCIGIHYGVGNVEIEDNVFFDSAGGVVSQNKQGATYSMYDSNIMNNIFQEVGAFANISTINTPLCIAAGNNNISMQGNTLVDCRYYMLYLSSTTNSDFTLNTIINQELAGIAGTPGSVVTEPNDIYTSQQGLDNGYTEDYVFTTDKFTNSPRVITLPNVVKT